MNWHEDLASRIVASLAALSECEQAEAMQAEISVAIKQMSIYRILELRERIQGECDPDSSVVAATLHLIDGQVALREIAGRSGWR